MPAYSQQSMLDLSENTRYESWLLEAAYEITEESPFREWPDQMIYPADGNAPTHKAMGYTVADLTDWRPGFKRVAAPLIFVTAFKLLDMVVEWILDQNGEKTNLSFIKKIRNLKTSLTFPPYVASRQWLQERLIALYEHLVPLRNTIIHSRDFTTDNGAVDVDSSRGKNEGSTVSLSADNIRYLAVFIVSLLKYLDGSWSADSYREKVLRRALDDLALLHRQPSLNQKPPYFLTVRGYVISKDTITIDVERLHRDVRAKLPRYDVVFDFRLIAIEPDSGLAKSYLLPWDILSQKRTGCIECSIHELVQYETDLPDDFEEAETVLAKLSAPQSHRPVVY